MKDDAMQHCHNLVCSIAYFNWKMIQYSQQQCNKDHSAVNSLTVLHFPLTALYTTPALQTNKTRIKYQLSSYFIV